MKAYHTLVTGKSGGGKTTLLRQMHAEFDGISAFVTPKDNESGVAGKRVRGRKALDTAVSEASEWNDIRVKWYDASFPEDLQTVREWAHDVHDYSGVPVQIIVDECQQTGLSDSEGPLKEGLHEDRDRAIKWVPATQSPQDLKESRGYPGIGQCRYIVWCGGTHVLQSGFIKHYDLDEAGLPESQYHYHVIEPSIPPRVVYRGETDRRYA